MPQSYLDNLDVDERADAWRRRLTSDQDRSFLLVGTKADRVVGFVTFGAARDTESGDAGELMALNVHPEFWGAGVGGALLNTAHIGLSDIGYHDAVLWVLPGNVRARRFYERNGWQCDEHQRVIELQGVTVADVRYARRLP